MIRGIHHLALNTNNLERLKLFYVGVLGFEIVDTAEWADSDLIDETIGLKGSGSAAKLAVLRAGNCYLELFEYSAPPARDAGSARACDHGYTHFCLDVTDIDAEYDRLVKAGMVFARRPADLGSIEGPAAAPAAAGRRQFPAIRAVYGRDPDGNIIEIQEVLGPQIPYHPSRLRQLIDA